MGRSGDVNGSVIFLLPFYFHHTDGQQNKSGAEWILIVLQIYIQMTFRDNYVSLRH